MELSDELLVPLRPSQRAAHVPKKAQRNKALSVVFDPKDHRDYLTGFRKRKQQRRKEALSKLEKQAKQQRLEERAERREALKQQYAHLPPEPEDDEPTAGGQKDISVFERGALKSTVTVSAIQLHSDDEQEGEEEEGSSGAESSDEGDDLHTGSGAPSRRAPAQATPAGGRREEGPKQGVKMTKAALRTMTKTRLKLQGKKEPRRSGGGPAKHGGSGGKKQKGGRGRQEAGDRQTQKKGKGRGR